MLHLKEIKPGQLLRLEHTLRSNGFVMSPGEHLVQAAAYHPPDRYGWNYSTLSTLNLESGKKETIYPCPALVPLVEVAQSEEMKAKLLRVQRKAPGGFVGFGAGMSLGTDPEVFVVNRAGQVLPAFTFLGDKASSEKAGWCATGTHTQAYLTPYWDGFQAEFNVFPVSCIAYLTDRIQGGLMRLYQLAKAHNAHARLSAQPVMPVPPEALVDGEEQHVELGCMPSENVYGDAGEPIANGRELPIRFAGFHLHFNTAPDKAKTERLPHLVRMMDKLCGIISVSVLQGMEDPIRRRYYGLAGEYRTPPHGLEWRVLSSAVLWHPALVHLHFNMARCGLQIGWKGMERLWQGSDEEARDIVNSLDVRRAHEVLERNRDLVVGCLQDTYFFASRDYAEEVYKRVVVAGMREHIELDMTANWALNKDDLTSGCWVHHSGKANCQFQSLAKGLKLPVPVTQEQLR